MTVVVMADRAKSADGHDMDHYADDLAALTAHLDLKHAVHVGHSTGGGEVVRYLARHGESRVAKAVLISAVPPLMVQTPANPGGLPKSVFDDLQRQLAESRSQFYLDVASGPFYGFNRPGANRSDAVVWNWWRQGMMGGIKAHYDGIVAFSQTDFTEDLKKITVPTLVMHGDDDQIVPYADSGPLTAKLVKRHRENLQGLSSWHADDACRSHQRRPARLHQRLAAPNSSHASSNGGQVMKIVVIGGSGLIGSKTVERLRKKGHDVVSASPNSGVNTITGEGVAEAVAGAQVVIDLSNSPSFDEKSALAFFETSGKTLLAAEAAAGVKHHVALSVVGAERLQGGGYFRAKMAQEKLIQKSEIPYTIVHSTQFFEFTKAIAQSGTVGQVAHVPTAFFQPIFSDDVADAMTAVALAAPVNGIVEIAGPEKLRMSDLVTRFFKATKDPREVVGDKHALYYGYEIDDRTLVPGDNPRIGATRFEDWLERPAAQR